MTYKISNFYELHSELQALTNKTNKMIREKYLVSINDVGWRQLKSLIWLRRFNQSSYPVNILNAKWWRESEASSMAKIYT
jgi:hypothetical protein